MIDLDKTLEEIVAEKLEFDEFTTCFKHERRRSALLEECSCFEASFLC